MHKPFHPSVPPCGRPPQHPVHFGDINYTAEQINALLGMIPYKADRAEVPQMEKLSDVNYVGHVADASLLTEQERPSWALVGDIKAAKPYFFYVDGFVPQGYTAGWNDVSGALGTYDLTADKISIYDFNLVTEYNVSRNHKNTKREFSKHWGATTLYYPEYEDYMPCKLYEEGDRVNMPGYTDHSFIALHQTERPPFEIVSEARSFTLEEAIALVPEDFRFPGIRVTFVDSETDNAVTWVYLGGEWGKKSSWVKPAEGNISVTNFPDEEDLTSTAEGTLKMKDKAYEPDSYSGLGRIFLRKNIVNGVNILTQDMLVKENTRYVIQYDYDLGSAEITIPEGCVLDFQGGSLNNGTLIGVKTYIDAGMYSIFRESLTLDGVFTNSYFYTSNFGIVSGTDITESLQRAIANTNLSGVKKLILSHGSYYLSGTVTMPSRMDFGGECNDSLAGWKYTGEVPVLIQTVDAPALCLVNTDSNLRNVSIHDISIRTADDYTGTKENLYGIYANDAKNVLGCSFKNIFLLGLKFGMYFNVIEGGGFAYNTFINVGLVRNIIGLFIDCTTTSNLAWCNHNYFRMCYMNENSCGAVYVKTIQSVQTLYFQSCTFEGNGWNSTEDYYAAYGCFAFNGRNMSYGFVTFESCYFELNIPRDSSGKIFSSVDYSKEGHIVIYGGKIEVRHSVIARVRQFITSLERGSIYLSKNDYYLHTKVNDTYSTSLIRFMNVKNNGMYITVNIDEPTIGSSSYIDRPYEFNDVPAATVNSLYSSNLSISCPAFQPENIYSGIYSDGCTIYIDPINGNNQYNGLSAAHPYPNVSTFRYYGSGRYSRIRKINLNIRNDISLALTSFTSDNPLMNKEVFINGNGYTLTVPDKTVFNGRNLKITFKNCKLVVDNTTGWYNTIVLTGENVITFEGCEITFTTGNALNFINPLSSSELTCNFIDSTVSSEGTPASGLQLIKRREESRIRVYTRNFTNEQNIPAMSDTNMTDAFFENAETYNEYKLVQLVRREDGKAYLFTDKVGKVHNADGTYIANVTII